jgi:hypothetical protein
MTATADSPVSKPTHLVNALMTTLLEVGIGCKTPASVPAVCRLAALA